MNVGHGLLTFFRCMPYTDYEIEGTEIQGTVLKFLKIFKGHQYSNFSPQGTPKIGISRRTIYDKARKDG